MADLPYAELQGYFSPEELTILEQGRDLPMLGGLLEKMCLQRVGTVALDHLIKQVSRTNIIPADHVVPETIQHPHMLDGAGTMKVAVAPLNYYGVNESWELYLRVGVPADTEDVEFEKPKIVNHDPTTRGIYNHRAISYAQVEWILSEEAYKAAAEDMCDPDQEMYSEGDKLRFTRVGERAPWESRTRSIPVATQLDVMLLLGRTAAIPLPHPIGQA